MGQIGLNIMGRTGIIIIGLLIASSFSGELVVEDLNYKKKYINVIGLGTICMETVLVVGR